MKTIGFSLLFAGVAVTPAFSCDLCSIYSANQAHGEMGKGFLAGVAEQYTHFATTQLDGVEVPNTVGQYLNSSISQVFVGYNFTPRFGLQFNLPIIYRSYKRPDGFAIQYGTVNGIGDTSLIGHLALVQKQREDWSLHWTVLGGVKFSTGDSSLLAEEFNETEVPGAPESGIHGHDLVLGSGSVDGVVGTSFFASWKRGFFSANMQYAARTTGSYDYRYANDITWSGGPGVYLLLGDVWTLSLQLNISGESKGLDTFQGSPAEDTGMTAVSLGPLVQLGWQSTLSADLGVDIPVIQNNTAFQTVPNYRIRGSVTFRF